MMGSDLGAAEATGQDAAATVPMEGPSPFGPAEMESIIPAARMRDCIRASERMMDGFRRVGDDNVAYWLGRYYGIQKTPQPQRPLNLIAQQIRAYTGKLVPQRLLHAPSAKRAGLELEAMVLRRLLEQDDQEQQIIENVYEPAIVEAMFYPCSITYTSLRPGLNVLDTAQTDIDPGEPMVLHIPFGQYVFDPFATDYRSRQWEGHWFRAPKQALLEAPAYSHPATQAALMSMPTYESKHQTKSVGGSDSAMFETVQLYNIVVYHHGGVYEGTIAGEDGGDPVWLRAARWVGPDGGPYDRLAFQAVPGMLVPAAMINNSREIAEVGDALANKVIKSALASKRLLGYEEGAADEAEAMATNEDLTTIKMNDVRKAAVFDLNMVSRDLLGIADWVQQKWDEASGQTRMMSGADTEDPTLGQADLRNAQSSEQVAYMQAKIDRLASSHARKRATLFLTNPAANYQTFMRVPSFVGGPGEEVIQMQLTAQTRVGAAEDYVFDTSTTSVAQGSPELRARRVLEAARTVAELMPLFQAGIFKLPQTLRMLDRTVAPDLLELAGDDTMMMEMMLAQAGQDQVYQAAKSGTRTEQPTTMQGVRQEAFGAH